MPASSSRWVNRIEVYWQPLSLWWISCPSRTSRDQIA